MTTKPVRITCTSEDFLVHREEYDGVCTSCGEIMYGGCEPEMENRPCDSCGHMSVLGFEQALLLGHVLVVFVGE
jgi:hypothetical protein